MHETTSMWRRGLLCGGFSILACAASLFRTGAAPAGFDASDRFFARTNVPHFRITVASTNLDALRRNARAYVPATVEEDGKTYARVGLHLKGAAGSFQPIDAATPAFTLNFDKFEEGQNFHGLDKLHLNNSVQDPSLLTEAICSRLFLEAGVPTARSGHARVEFNGRDLGLYVLKEGFDRTFLRRHFKNPDGNLYDGGFLQDITDGLQKDSGLNDVNDRSDLRALVAAAREPNLSNRLERLERKLDVDRFLTFVVLEMMTWHWDGYALKKNNYRVFHDLETGRMVFFPHGMDQMFWYPNEAIISSGFEGLVARQALQIPELRRRYFERMSRLMTNVFTVEKLTNHINELHARIRPELASISPQRAREHDNAVKNLRNQILARHAVVQQRLADPEPTPLRFGPDGVAQLTNWQPLDIRGTGRWEQLTDADGVRTLHVATSPDGRCTASWRRRVFLTAGNYVFEARVRTAGVVPLEKDVNTKGAGAGIRRSNSSKPRTNSAIGDTPWQEVRYEFTVEQESEEVPLLCELRAEQGEAWFNLKSLRLRRR